MRAFIRASGQIAGFHRWPNAPDEVAFLRDKHRHMFHISVKVAVKHDDRDTEFFLLKRASVGAVLVRYRSKYENFNGGLDFGTKSCEQLATELGSDLLALGYAVVEVTWSEDGENEAVVEFD